MKRIEGVKMNNIYDLKKFYDLNRMSKSILIKIIIWCFDEINVIKRKCPDDPLEECKGIFHNEEYLCDMCLIKNILKEIRKEMKNER